MLTKGIQYNYHGDEEDVGFHKIFAEIKDGESLHWAVLGMDAWRNVNGKKSSVRVFGYEKILLLNWEELKVFTSNLYNFEEGCVIGCKDEKDLRFYETDREMFESCDISIYNIDGMFWEVFSKDEAFITRLASKFKDVTFLKSDYRNEYTDDA